MAKRTARRGTKRATGRKKTAARRPQTRRRAGKAKGARTSASKRPRTRRPARAPAKSPRLERDRRRLGETVPTPPSSLNLNRRGSAVRTGRAEIAQARQAHATMTPAITGGDVDADVENAYFSGDEAPGGDNPTPDQDIVDDIGKAIGLQYEDTEELGSEKVVERDKHRWELDPASSDDYKERK